MKSFQKTQKKLALIKPLSTNYLVKFLSFWLFFSILIITINSYNYSSSQLSDTIARFAFIAAVAFRLLPSINRIVGSIQGIIYRPNIKHIRNLLIDKEFNKIKKLIMLLILIKKIIMKISKIFQF